MKNNKKLKTTLIVFAILLTLIVCFNAGVYAAYALAATDVSYTKPDGTQTNIKEALDEVYAKVPSHEIGDEVTVGGEQFYVLEWDNNCDTVNLLAKRCLNLQGDAQIPETYSSSSVYQCKFSSTNYWASSYSDSSLGLNDFIGFTSTDALGKAKSYGKNKGAISSRLLSYEEAQEIKESSNSKKSKLFAEQGEMYWLGTAKDSDSIYYISVPFIRSTSYSIKNAGVRPVITILKSKIS